MTQRAHSWRTRADIAFQRFAGRLTAAIPAPPELALLGPARARLVAAIVARRAGDIARLRTEWLTHGEDCSPDGDRARADLARLGDEAVDELRASLADRSAAAEAHGALARLASTAASYADRWVVTHGEEYLDMPHFDERLRTSELRSIDRFNRGFGSYTRFADALAPLLSGDGPVTVLDIASGHGGFPIALASMAAYGAGEASPRQRLRVIASDLRDEYLAIGRRRAARAGLHAIEFRVADALHLGESFAPGEIDVITCTQSLHHFGSGATCMLLAEAIRHARRGILFVDLVRTPTSALAASALGLLALNRLVLHDSVLSFRKSFVPEELALLAACVPGGERLEALFLAPAFTALRTRTPLEP